MYETYHQLEQLLVSYNWISDPYDSDTLMAYPSY